MTKTSHPVFKKLMTLVRTQLRMIDWVDRKATTNWPKAKRQIYLGAQEASRLIRDKRWIHQFTAAERAEIKRLLRRVRDNTLDLYKKLDRILIEQRKRVSSKKGTSAK